MVETLTTNNAPTVISTARGDRIPSSWILVWLLAGAGTSFAVLCKLLSQPTGEYQMAPLCALLFIASAAANLTRNRPKASSRSWVGLMVMLFFSVASMLAALLFLNTVFIISIIGWVASFIWAINGWRQARHYVPLFIFAACALLELPDELRLKISVPLQTICTNTTYWIAHCFIRVQLAGPHAISINGSDYEIAPACSGLNQWLGLTDALILMCIFLKLPPKRVFLGLASVPAVAVLMNVLRLTTTLTIANFSSKESAMAVHTNIELLFFPIGIFLVWLVVRGRHAKA